MGLDAIPLQKIDPATPGYGKLMQQAKDYEGVFLNTLTKEMFSSIKSGDDKDTGGGFAEDTWRGMQAEQFANILADQGGVGLAQSLMPTLLSLQEASQSSGAGVQP